MFEKEKRELIKGGMKLDRYGLVSLAGGNLSLRMPTGEILVTPSGMIYEDMVEDDVVVMDVNGKIIEGTRKPSSDTEAILYIFRERPDINAVIHTHQPYATAISLIQDEFRADLGVVHLRDDVVREVKEALLAGAVVEPHDGFENREGGLPGAEAGLRERPAALAIGADFGNDAVEEAFRRAERVGEYFPLVVSLRQE